jgi:hypothetical protein
MAADSLQLSYTVTEIELLAALESIRTWRPYLWWRPFIVIIDHAAGTTMVSHHEGHHRRRTCVAAHEVDSQTTWFSRSSTCKSRTTPTLTESADWWAQLHLGRLHLPAAVLVAALTNGSSALTTEQLEAFEAESKATYHNRQGYP